VPEPLTDALASVRTLLLDERRLVRAVAAGRRRGAELAWRRVEVRPVDVRAGRRLQVVRYDEQQAHTANVGLADASALVDELLALPFGNWHVETVDETVQLRVTKKGAAQVHRAGGVRREQRTGHDRAKPRLLDPADPFLVEVGISSADGRVKPSRQDKLRQVEDFLRALDPVLEPVAALGRPVRVVDLGCGNAYLTLAAYRHLTARGLEVDLVGVDVKAQARERNSAIVARLGWSDDVRFVEGAIADAAVAAADVVLALHACDTATDEALARAIGWQAAVVLAAPCCHHDVSRQLREHGQPPIPYALLTRHGIVRERFADTLTDALRAALLRLHGYRVEVIEFVESTHTPRNTLLRAVRTGAPAEGTVRAEYDELTAAWGVAPALERLAPLPA
jgi:SAM-dependent methyltransferase